MAFVLQDGECLRRKARARVVLFSFQIILRGCRGIWEVFRDASGESHQLPRDLRVVKGAPAAVRVSRAQTFPAGCVLLARLHRDSGHLERKQNTHLQSILTPLVCTLNRQRKKQLLASLQQLVSEHCKAIRKLQFKTHKSLQGWKSKGKKPSLF